MQIRENICKKYAHHADVAVDLVECAIVLKEWTKRSEVSSKVLKLQGVEKKGAKKRRMEDL
jgi:hypothetical protein